MSNARQPITVVTGARKGIGRHLAQHYVAKGHRVIGCSRQAADFSLDGYEHALVDVSDEAAVGEVFSTIRKKYDVLDNLINNAGIASMNHCMLTPLDTAQRIVQTNLIGTFLLSRDAARLMRRNGGRIVNFTTVARPLKLDGEAIYAASKAAVESLTEVMARELASYGITVNAVGPTPVDTDLTRTVPKQKLDALLARQAIPRFGTFEDVANVVDFFLSPQSAFITGQTLYLGGV
ncbi:SDR family NAD(P)-dependent oxidoreductase [Paraburkholderia lacunae]|uniref:SDR family NAD(P)-dependent oxidoreductase n=1 Tax=Paraburkholderia lacunae TaxID=2211104 RepID=UPI001AD7FF19|nr:SDR family oxidoreductase [Paraburkholderia lacunae]